MVIQEFTHRMSAHRGVQLGLVHGDRWEPGEGCLPTQMHLMGRNLAAYLPVAPIWGQPRFTLLLFRVSAR